uniref:Uncharacterized protein n=1 Tax=Anguilla anguilla TaxID=7936 RepID=A0A0E9RYM4_ANGAN
MPHVSPYFIIFILKRLSVCSSQNFKNQGILLCLVKSLVVQDIESLLV